jgi:hypothetical protein
MKLMRNYPSAHQPSNTLHNISQQETSFYQISIAYWLLLLSKFRIATDHSQVWDNLAQKDLTRGQA